MTEATNIQWKRLSIEAAAIVASILLAFAIDAWWAEQNDRRAESEILDRLHEEFTLNRDEIGARGTQNRVQVASTELFELLEAHGGSDERLIVKNTLFFEATITPTINPSTPVLDGLILSGQLDVIRDEDVLTAITNWQRWEAQILEMEIDARDFARSQLIPVLSRKGYMGRAFRTQHPDGETSIIVDNELLGLMSKRAYGADRILAMIDVLKESASQLLLAIENTQDQ